MTVSLKTLAPQVGASLEDLVKVCEILNIPVQEISGGQKVINHYLDSNNKQADPVAMLKRLADLAAENQKTLVEAAYAVVAAQNQSKGNNNGTPAMFSEVIERYKGQLFESAIDIRLQGEDFLEETIVKLAYVPAAELREKRQEVQSGTKRDHFTGFFSQSRNHSSLNTWDLTAPALTGATATQSQQLPQSQVLQSQEPSSSESSQKS